MIVGNYKYFTVTEGIRFLLVLLITAFLSANTPSAARAGCHCFRDRSFDPSHPASADSYVLATARNSLVAAASNTDKKNVIKMRMTGTSETDLWLSLYLESDWGRLDRISPSFTKADREKDRKAMAAALADGALERTFRVGREVLSDLRSFGTDTSEITLSLLVSSRTRPTPMEVLTRIRSGKTTWSQTLDSIGIALDTTGDLIAAQVKRAREESVQGPTSNVQR